jgi:hypothetical protein
VHMGLVVVGSRFGGQSCLLSGCTCAKQMSRLEAGVPIGASSNKFFKLLIAISYTRSFVVCYRCPPGGRLSLTFLT